MLSSLGDPHLAAEYVHVGGTNGKGSTAALVDSVLRRSGKLTGLYTSPHLSSFAERIRIDGVDAESDLLERCAARVRPLADSLGSALGLIATLRAFGPSRRSGRARR